MNNDVLINELRDIAEWIRTGDRTRAMILKMLDVRVAYFLGVVTQTVDISKTSAAKQAGCDCKDRGEREASHDEKDCLTTDGELA